MPGALAATTEHMPAMAAEVQVKDGSFRACWSPASLFWHTGPDPSGGQEHVQARGELAMMTAHMPLAAALAQETSSPSPKILATSRSSSLHPSVAEDGSAPACASPEVMDDVSTRQVGSSTRELRLETSTLRSSGGMVKQSS